MKPKPFSSLNHFTVPVGTVLILHCWCAACAEDAVSNGPAYVALLSTEDFPGLYAEERSRRHSGLPVEASDASARRISRRGARCGRAPRGTRPHAGEPGRPPVGRARDPTCGLR